MPWHRGFAACDEPHFAIAGLEPEKKTLHAAEQDRPDVQRARADFAEKAAKVAIPNVVFFDEFGTNIGMTPTHAYAPVGERAVNSAPSGHGENTTLILGVGLRGVVAPFAFAGAMNAHLFAEYIAHQVAPKLHRGDVIILDGLGLRAKQSKHEEHTSGFCPHILPT